MKKKVIILLILIAAIILITQIKPQLSPERCLKDKHCRNTICPAVIGQDTPRCDVYKNECTCGAQEETYFISEFRYDPEIFTFKLTNQERIAEARSILKETVKENPKEDIPLGVMGIITKSPQPYNTPWGYHFDPSTVEFFEYAPEECDSHPQYVEDHLNEFCGEARPHCLWCPWPSILAREVNAFGQQENLQKGAFCTLESQCKSGRCQNNTCISKKKYRNLLDLFREL
tara:strand:+ start:504 stop:1193 length:690 start_codon:yes stop_codon:yes gene_type:complete